MRSDVRRSQNAPDLCREAIFVDRLAQDRANAALKRPNYPVLSPTDRQPFYSAIPKRWSVIAPRAEGLSQSGAARGSSRSRSTPRILRSQGGEPMAKRNRRKMRLDTVSPKCNSSRQCLVARSVTGTAVDRSVPGSIVAGPVVAGYIVPVPVVAARWCPGNAADRAHCATDQRAGRCTTTTFGYSYSPDAGSFSAPTVTSSNVTQAK